MKIRSLFFIHLISVFAINNAFSDSSGTNLKLANMPNAENAALLYYQAIAVGPARSWITSEVYEEISVRKPRFETQNFVIQNEFVFSLLLDATASAECEWNTQAIPRPGQYNGLVAPVFGAYKSLVIGLSYYFYWHVTFGDPVSAWKSAAAMPRLLDNHPTMDYLPFSPLRTQLDDIALQYLAENLGELGETGKRQLFEAIKKSKRTTFVFPVKLYLDYLQLISKIKEELVSLEEDKFSSTFVDSIVSRLHLSPDNLINHALITKPYLLNVLEINRSSAQQLIDISTHKNPLDVRAALAGAAKSQSDSLPVTFDLKVKEVIGLLDADLVRRIRWHMLYVVLGTFVEGGAFLDQNPNPFTGMQYTVQKESDTINVRATEIGSLGQVELVVKGSVESFNH